MRLYVFGHELTHAIWVWLWGGKVYEKQWWSRDGGYIVTDTHNFWIALAPYFYPLYSLVVVLAFGIGSLFYDLTNSTATFLLMTPLQWLFLLLGATWAFHLTFTVWMIPKGQTDLSSHGTFFSLVIIYLMNVILLSVFLVVAAPELSLFLPCPGAAAPCGGFFGIDLYLGQRLFRAAMKRRLRMKRGDASVTGGSPGDAFLKDLQELF